MIAILSLLCAQAQWQVKHTVDPMTDQTTSIAQLESTNLISGPLGTAVKTTLIVRCRRANLEVYVATPLLMHDDRGWTHVRVGTHPPVPVVAELSSDNTTYFLETTDALIALLMSPKEPLKVELLPFGQLPVAAEFTLGSTHTTISPIVDQCSAASKQWLYEFYMVRTDQIPLLPQKLKDEINKRWLEDTATMIKEINTEAAKQQPPVEPITGIQP
jgi:hypothetical protein